MRRLLRCLQTAFCVHRFVCAPPCICTALLHHRGWGACPRFGYATPPPHFYWRLGVTSKSEETAHLRGTHKRWSVATAVALLFKGATGGSRDWVKRAVVHIQGDALTRPCRHKAVQTQDGAHQRRSVATARVFLFSGVVGISPPSSEASRSPHTQGGTYTRRCTYKALYIQGGADKRWSVATRGFFFKGGAGVSSAWSEASRSPQTRRCIHKAVQIQGGAHKRRSLATA